MFSEQGVIFCPIKTFIIIFARQEKKKTHEDMSFKAFFRLHFTSAAFILSKDSSISKPHREKARYALKHVCPKFLALFFPAIKQMGAQLSDCSDECLALKT